MLCGKGGKLLVSRMRTFHPLVGKLDEDVVIRGNLFLRRLKKPTCKNKQTKTKKTTIGSKQDEELSIRGQIVYKPDEDIATRGTIVTLVSRIRNCYPIQEKVVSKLDEVIAI
jgi:hypothetical protein